MIAPLLSLLLAAKLVAHSGQMLLPRNMETDRTTSPYSTIKVVSCNDEFVPVYQDPKGVILIIGDIPTDSYGEYKFFTASPYLILRVYYQYQMPPLFIISPA